MSSVHPKRPHDTPKEHLFPRALCATLWITILPHPRAPHRRAVSRPARPALMLSARVPIVFYTFILLCLGGACFETEKSRADHRYRSGRGAGHLAADDPLCRPGLRWITPGRPLPSLPRRCAAGRFFLSAHIGCAALQAAGSFCTHCVGGHFPVLRTGMRFAAPSSFSPAAKQAFFAHSVGGERLHPTFLFLLLRKRNGISALRASLRSVALRNAPADAGARYKEKEGRSSFAMLRAAANRWASNHRVCSYLEVLSHAFPHQRR